MDFREFDSEAFLAKIDEHPDLQGIRVVYVDNGGVHVLRAGPPYCGVDLKATVIRPYLDLPTLQDPAIAETRDSKILGEVLAASLGCSAALLSWIVVIGSTGAMPLTGGGSVFLTYLGIAAATASSIQCANGLGRVVTEATVPEKLDIVDSYGWYRKVSLILDGISLTGGITSTAATIKVVLGLKRTTGKSMTEVLKGLSRQERNNLAEEIIRLRNPGISNQQIKVLVKAGVFPKRYSNTQISHAIQVQLLDAAGAAIGFTGSATSGVIRYAIGISQSVETYK